jgi:hypothetical protein
MNWKIYYADGTTASSEDMGWNEAPQDGVVAICVKDDTYGKVVLNGKDFYYHVQGGGRNDLYGTNDLAAQHRARCPWLKFGVGIPSDKYREILAKATRDPDFPVSQNPHRRAADGERER